MSADHKDSRALDTVFAIAPKDPLEARKIAREIRDPRFRCQALAFAAAHTPTAKQRRLIIARAFKAADELPHLRRRLIASAWPLQALLQTGMFDEFNCELERMFQNFPRIQPVERQDVLLTIMCMIPQMPDESFDKVIEEFKKATNEGIGWKISYNLQKMAKKIEPRNHHLAVELAFMAINKSDKRKILRTIGEKELAEQYQNEPHHT